MADHQTSLVLVALAAVFAAGAGLCVAVMRRLLARQAELERQAAQREALELEVQHVRERLVQGLEAEQERDRLFNLSLDMLAVARYDGFLEQVNPAWVRVLGWSRDDLMSRPVLSFVHPDEQAAVALAIGRLETGEPVTGLECRFECRDGSFRWLSWNSFPYVDRRRIFSVVRDITVRKRGERLLLENQERLRALSNQLASVEDRERRQLAEAIHDGLAQQLFGVRAQVTLLKYPEKIADQRTLVAEIIAALDDALTQARSLTFELFPPVLYEVGLAGALEWLGRQYEQRSGIRCEVEVDGGEPALPESLRMMAYQSVRELLANVRKHAQATAVTVTLGFTDGEVRLSVEDDGVGFDPVAVENALPTASGGGFGLFSMRERLRSVGGGLAIASVPGQGSRLELTFPAVVGD